MAKRVVIVGGGAAGMSAAAKARRLDPSLEIAVYERSGYVSFGACGFPYAIKGEIARVEDVVVRTLAQFARQGIQVFVRHEALSIDPAARSVRVRNRDSVDELAELDLAYAPPFSPVWDPILVAANLARR